MKLLHPCGVVSAIVAIGLTSGCDRGEKASPAERPQATQITKIDVDGLPELDDPVGPLDEQRLEVAPPRGWHVPSRDSRWIVRFAASQQTRYPSIIVRAEDYNEIFNVSRSNVDAFAGQIAAAFHSDASAAEQSMTLTPIEIGRFTGVSYRRRGTARYGVKPVIVERLLLDTVAMGRKYTVELQAREGDLDEYRPCLYAVAAGIEFLRPEPTEDGAKEP